MGTIYLLQELTHSSKKFDIYRLDIEYNKKKKPNILLQLGCSNNIISTHIELKEIFKNIFKHRTDIGENFFQGNYKTMIRMLSKCVISKEKSIDKDEETVATSELIIEPDVLFHFQDVYKNDRTMGGDMHYFKINIIKTKANAHYVIECIFMIRTLYKLSLGSIRLNSYLDMDSMGRKYFDTLTNDGVLSHNTIYMLSPQIVNLIDTYKYKLTDCIVHDSTILKNSTISLHDSIASCLKKILFKNTIINSIYYVDTVNLSHIDSIGKYHNILIGMNKYIHFFQYDKKQYIDIAYIEQYFPYCCEVSLDGNKICIINIESRYINIKNQSFKDDEFKNISVKYFFHYESPPWIDANILRETAEYYKQFVSNKIINNDCKETNKLMDILTYNK